MATEKKQSFLGGAAVLAFGIAACKVIGAVFKIPLLNLLGEAGSADFSNAYNIYATLLLISTAGLPVALSKMVSEANSLSRPGAARQAFRVSLAAFLTLGVISFALMWWGNDFLAGLINNPRAAAGIRALAPAVVCVGCLSAFRGFAQGSFRMTPTAVSQIIESLFKLFLGLALAMLLLRAGYPEYIAAAGAITGVTVGTIVSLIYMFFDFLRHRTPLDKSEALRPDSEVLKRLLSIAIPITLSSSMVSVVTLIDTSLVQGQLQQALGLTLNESRQLYGNYSACMNLYNLPSSLMVALTASVVPTLSAALAQKDTAKSSGIVGSSLRITALLSFPMGFGLWSISEPIFALLYPRFDAALGGRLLATLSFASIFTCLMLVTNSILQSYGRVHVPVFTMLLGGVVKIFLNYNLVAIPEINIEGSPIGTLTCFGLISVLNLAVVWRTEKNAPGVFSVFAKPLLASALMAAAAKGVYALAETVLHLPSVLCIALTVGVAVVVYAVLVMALRILTKDDVALLPKGEKVAKFLKIR